MPEYAYIKRFLASFLQTHRWNREEIFALRGHSAPAALTLLNRASLAHTTTSMGRWNVLIAPRVTIVQRKPWTTRTLLVRLGEWLSVCSRQWHLAWLAVRMNTSCTDVG